MNRVTPSWTGALVNGQKKPYKSQKKIIICTRGAGSVRGEPVRAVLVHIIDIEGWQWIPLTDDSYSEYAYIVHMIYLNIWILSLNYTFSKYAWAIN